MTKITAELCSTPSTSSDLGVWWGGGGSFTIINLCYLENCKYSKYNKINKDHSIEGVKTSLETMLTPSGWYYADADLLLFQWEYSIGSSAVRSLSGLFSLYCLWGLWL